MRNLLSASDPLLFCGSAPDEIWEGELLRGSFAAHIDEIPLGTLDEERLDAFDCGETGWALWVGRIRFSENDSNNLARITLIFGLEQGIWKILHAHNSWATKNIEMLGIEHTALQALLDTAGEQIDLGQTGIASVMFTDIADSSALAETLGDATWSKIVTPHVTRLGELIDAAGGNLVKSLGDGTLSAFPSAGAALQAAIAIQRDNDRNPNEPRLRLRVGIHTGDVVQTDDDFLGTVVNKAARVAAAAAPDDIRVSEATRVMVGSQKDLIFVDPAMVPLKGLDGEHLIYRLEWRD